MPTCPALPPPPPGQSACSSALARGYDLVAVQPSSERLFQLACASLEVDLIALDLSRRLPYRFKPSFIRAALARGVHFEVRCTARIAQRSVGWGFVLLDRLGWFEREAEQEMPSEPVGLAAATALKPPLPVPSCRSALHRHFARWACGGNCLPMRWRCAERRGGAALWSAAVHAATRSCGGL